MVDGGIDGLSCVWLVVWACIYALLSKSLMTLMLCSTFIWISLRRKLKSVGNNSSVLVEQHVVGISIVRVIL